MIKKTVFVIATTILSGMLMLLPVYAGDTDAWLSDWDYEIKELG